nr:2A2 [Potamipivirus A]
HQDRNQAFTRINLCYMKNEEGSFHYGLKVQGFVLHRPKGNILNEEHYWRKPVLSQMSGWTVCPEDYVSGSRMLDNLLLGSTMEIIHDPKGLFFGPETPFIMSWMAKYIAASYIPIQHRRNTWDEEVLFEEEFDDYHQEGGWIRDLTAEGVEPNPGPL